MLHLSVHIAIESADITAPDRENGPLQDLENHERDHPVFLWQKVVVAVKAFGVLSETKEEDLPYDHEQH